MTVATLFDALPLMPRPARYDEKSEENTRDLLYRITVDGVPVPKGRARARIVQPFRKKPFVQFYQEKETEAYEFKIKQESRRIIGSRQPLDEIAICVALRVFLPIPASWSGKKQAAALRGEILPLSKPDSDNFLKVACDGMNSIIFRDDSLVTDMRVEKRYSDNPRMEIEVFA
jgi:Holliday junction resolvase RusA-like endonuclease